MADVSSEIVGTVVREIGAFWPSLTSNANITGAVWGCMPDMTEAKVLSWHEYWI